VNKQRMVGSSDNILVPAIAYPDECCENVNSEGRHVSEVCMYSLDAPMSWLQGTPHLAVDLRVTILL
jgi:hypothetical protein